MMVFDRYNQVVIFNGNAFLCQDTIKSHVESDRTIFCDFLVGLAWV